MIDLALLGVGVALGVVALVVVSFWFRKGEM